MDQTMMSVAAEEEEERITLEGQELEEFVIEVEKTETLASQSKRSFK